MGLEVSERKVDVKWSTLSGPSCSGAFDGVGVVDDDDDGGGGGFSGGFSGGYRLLAVILRVSESFAICQ